jgi:polysaccharide biosynthesis protein PslG
MARRPSAIGHTPFAIGKLPSAKGLFHIMSKYPMLNLKSINLKVFMGCLSTVVLLSMCLFSGATAGLILLTQQAPPRAAGSAELETPTPTETPSTAAPSATATATATPKPTTNAPQNTPPTNTPTPPASQPTNTPAAAAPTNTPVPSNRPPAVATATYAWKGDIVPPPAPIALPMGSPEYGMQAFLWWRQDWMQRDERLVKAAGFGWIKQNFGWREIEPAKGQFDWIRPDRIVFSMNEIGLDLVVRLDFAPEWAAPGCHDDDPSRNRNQGPPSNMRDFANFVSAVATRYKGRIRAYEIWNEPNLSREWCDKPPSGKEYTDMLKAAYGAIKAADPTAWVISAGLSPTTRNDNIARPDAMFLQEMYDAGASKYFDLLGVHGAGFRAPPEADPGDVAKDPNLANPGDFANNVPEELRRVYCFRHVEDLRAVMVKNGDSKKQVALLEFGWTNDTRPNSPYAWHSVKTEDVKADYLVRAYKYAAEHWTPWIGLMSLIYVSDPNWTQNDEQYWWSITNPDGSPRAAYNALKAMPKPIK